MTEEHLKSSCRRRKQKTTINSEDHQTIYKKELQISYIGKLRCGNLGCKIDGGLANIAAAARNVLHLKLIYNIH